MGGDNESAREESLKERGCPPLFLSFFLSPFPFFFSSATGPNGDPGSLSAGLTSTLSPVTAFTATPLERCLSACKRDFLFFFFFLLRRVDRDSDELNNPPVYIDLTRRDNSPWRGVGEREFQEVTKGKKRHAYKKLRD